MAVIIALGIVSCKEDTCRIHGTIPQKYNGVRIFLVPLKDSSKEMVDSVVIHGGKFEFETTKYVIADIRLDYHHRMGIQNLLVVTEPGDIYVHIDSVSSSKGTPQNDSLQWWKDLTISHNEEMKTMKLAMNNALAAGDSASANTMMTLADSLHRQYKRATRRMANNVRKGPLSEFLLNMYPTSVKRKNADGTYTTIDLE